MSGAKTLVLFLACVAAASFLAIWIFQSMIGGKPYHAPWEPGRTRAEVEAVCRQHVDDAAAKASQAIERRSLEFSGFILSRKAGAAPFSKEIVSWYGKWRAVEPYIRFHTPPSPWGTGVYLDPTPFISGPPDNNGHKEFVAEKFNQHIFTADELAAALRRAVEEGLKDLEEIENELAVLLREEILGRSLAPDEAPIAADEFKRAVERIVVAGQWDAAKGAGNLAVAELAAVVAGQIFVRLGVSAGILAAGAANSWWTLGVSLVVGLIVDAIWNWVDDPAGDIEREVIAALDKLADDASTAIRDEMALVIAQRAGFWHGTVTEVLP